MSVAGAFIAVCAMLPLLLFHMSAPAMVLAALGGATVGLVVAWVVCMILLFVVFHDM